MSDKAPWITYRPELKVLDCTVRDGGLVNAHQFSDEFVGAVYRACVAAGVDYMEIGYKNSPRVFPKGKFGPWRHCDEADIRRVVGDHDADTTGLKLAAMADAGKSDWQTQIVPCAESPLDVIRVAFYAHQVSEAVEMIDHCHALGYETTRQPHGRLRHHRGRRSITVLEAIAKTPVGTMVIVDSFGHLYREQIDRLYKKYSGGAGRDRQGNRHSRPQQPATRLRQHHRGDHPRLRTGSTPRFRPRPRRRQLPHGTAARLPAQPEVQAAAGHRGDPEHVAPCARNWSGGRRFPTTSPVNSTVTRVPPSSGPKVPTGTTISLFTTRSSRRFECATHDHPAGAAA